MLSKNTPAIAETRELRAEQITSTVRPLTPFKHTFIVPSQSKRNCEYLVNTEAGYCTCPDSQYRGVVCKHLLAALRAENISQNKPAPSSTPKFKTYAILFAELGI